MNYKKVIKFYFNRKSPLPEDQELEKKKKRSVWKMNVVPIHKTHYWKTFSKSEKTFFWVISFVWAALAIILFEIIIKIVKLL